MAGYIGARSVTLNTTVATAQDVTATDTTPEVTIINNTHEDSDGGREGKLIFKGQQSGGEESTLALIQAAHDGSSDDEKGLLSFKTNDGNDSNSPTERWRITSDGHFKAMVNGYGIDFSVTEGSAATSSVLDDYEEGAWTPVMTGDGGSAGSASTTVYGATYTKVGNLVTVMCYIRFANIGSYSGNVAITGLPFTSANNGTRTAGTIDFLKRVELADNFNYSANIIANASVVQISRISSDQNTKLQAQVSYFNDALNEIIFNCSYTSA